MDVLIHLPESVAVQFGGNAETAAKQLLESAAVEGYRSGRLSRHQVRDMLGQQWQETEEFLAEHGCYRHYSVEDLEKDRATLAELDNR